MFISAALFLLLDWIMCITQQHNFISAVGFKCMFPLISVLKHYLECETHFVYIWMSIQKKMPLFKCNFLRKQFWHLVLSQWLVMVLLVLGFIGSWLFGVYAERQENVGAEERSRTVESNREKLSCFGAQSSRPSVASLSACYERCCILQTSPGFTWTTRNIIRNVYNQGLPKSSRLQHLFQRLEQVTDSELQTWVWSWWRDITPPHMGPRDGKRHHQGREAQRLSEVQHRRGLRLSQAGPAESIETLGAGASLLPREPACQVGSVSQQVGCV